MRMRILALYVPTQTDVLVVGGGVIGWAVAFWLRWSSKFSVTVVERDPTYARSASVLGLGSIRQQFSEPENIQMSLFASEFLRNVKDYLTVLDNTQLDIEFNPQGCLILANQSQAETLEQNFQLQLYDEKLCYLLYFLRDLGAKVELLDKSKLKSRWPWLNIEDVEVGCYGYENEGWFDPWLLLKALRAKCHMLGVNYVVGEVVDFEASRYMHEITFPDMPERAPVIGLALREAVLEFYLCPQVALPNGSKNNIKFSMVVDAAGPWASDLARLAEIGVNENLSVPLPVEPRLRHVFVVRPKRRNPLAHATSGPFEADATPLPGLDTPFLIDPSRLFVERRGLSGEFIVYSDDPQWDIPRVVDEAAYHGLDVDHNLFKTKLKDQLGHRIPSLSSVEVVSAWTAICDYNTVDQNLIIGHHPFHVNMFFCNGSSGHGTQHAVAIGRAISELILYGHYKTIDLTRFSFDRLCLHEQITETNAF
ncbi:FAD-dependent oxidoreductase domain-containing protein 1 [Fasciola hepatica]|uniref:FAD-dependent oxidoreductase domain-containing protein 1 n=1 Tax=Fasciola hepatica TaxID=6192 RepID=A0A4E0RZX4_FASHE|nr:FAD-dependent oxidoreductase domain-containing protein 1 [Fasciola hepatica]